MTAPGLHAKRLRTYLNDHLAVASAGVALAKRSLGSNEGTPYESVLRRLHDDLEQDLGLMREIMRTLDVGEDPLKQGLARLGEKLGRLKLNDSLTSYSPLSRTVELEGLMVVIGILRNTWASLADVLADDARVPDTTAARERAEANLRDLDALRPQAVREALLS